MRRHKIDQPFRDSSLSRSNMFKSLPELPSLQHCHDDDIERKSENILYEPNMNDSQWQSFVKRQNAFESDSRTSFWHGNVFIASRNAAHNQCCHNMICSVFQLQSHLNACSFCSCQFNNAHIHNAFGSSSSSSSIPSLPHWSVSGCTKQSIEKHFGGKDLSDKENRKLTRQHFVMVFSICYAIFLVVFGSIVFIGDVVDSQYPLPQAFCIYMLLMALAYFLYLFVDIRLHIHRVKNELKDRMERKQLVDTYVKTTLNNDGTLKRKLATLNGDVYTLAKRELNLPPLPPISRRYSFISKENGVLLYVKMGASLFGFGLFVYSALQVSYDVFFISSYGTNLYDCASYVTLALNIVFPLYSLFTQFFIIKYMNVVINVNRNLARIFLMHAIGTSLSLWVFTIIRETADAIAESDAEKPGLHRTTKANDTFEFVYNDCGKSNALSAIHRQFAPYLYPFVIEYCILAVGIWCRIYENINNCPRKSVNSTTNDNHEQSTQHDASSEYYSIHGHKRDSNYDEAIPSTSSIRTNCSSSFNGIFSGLLLLIMSIVFIILVFVGLKHKAYLRTSILINNIFECSILIILIVSTTIAYSKLIKLDINPNLTQRLQLDDIFLLISIPAYFINSILTLVPAFKSQNTVRICISLLRFMEVLIQTPFIIDGRRRCLNSSSQDGKKSDRQLIIFLAIANLTLWVYHTFSGKIVYANDECFSYYGYYLWNILNHICLPLTMFYRFHSSVCLVEIWNNAFIPVKKHK